MKARGNVFRGMLMAVFMLVFLLALTGCKTFFNPAGTPSDQKTPIVLTPETAQVLMNATNKGEIALASALESNTENGSVIYADRNGYLLTPEGLPFIDKNGMPLKVSSKVVAKLNSLQNFKDLQGVKEAEYIVGGYEHLQYLPDGLKNMMSDASPCLLKLRIVGIDAAAINSPVPDARKAAAVEREAIIKALAVLAEKRGIAYATKVDALANGLTKITVGVGEAIIGRVLGTYAVEAAAASLSRVTEAVIQTPSGATARVLAAGEDAAALAAAAQAKEVSAVTPVKNKVANISGVTKNANGSSTATLLLEDGTKITGVAVGPTATSTQDLYTWQVTSADGTITTVSTTSTQNTVLFGQQ